jgi:hypothetical protein
MQYFMITSGRIRICQFYAESDLQFWSLVGWVITQMSPSQVIEGHSSVYGLSGIKKLLKKIEMIRKWGKGKENKNNKKIS